MEAVPDKTRVINADDSFDALTDAIADCYHIHDGLEWSVKHDIEKALEVAARHYRNERSGGEVTTDA